LVSSVKCCASLEQLLLKENNLSLESGDALLFLVKEKKNLWKVQVNLNMIRYQTQVEIEKVCKRNKATVKRVNLPEIKEEIKELHTQNIPPKKLEELDKKLKQ